MKVEFTNRPLPTHKYSDLKSGDLFTWQHSLNEYLHRSITTLVMMVVSETQYVVLNEDYVFLRLRTGGNLDNEPVHKLTGTLKVELV